ncbi:MAG: two-component regulator propeller domain-containing protein, partial [Bacteroidota bacterium]
MDVKTFILRFVFTALVLSAPLRAQYTIKQWNVEDGLPQSTVRCIAQTHDGYLWVGTWNGLARFDGVKMTVFNALNTPNLHPSISAIYEDRQYRLWIGTDGGGLLQYRGNEFVRFDSTAGISATIICSMDEDSAGRMWFATENGVFVCAGNRILHFTQHDGLPQKLANQVLSAPDGSMYLQFVGPTLHVRLSEDSLLILDKPFSTGGYRFDIDRSGALWIGEKGKGLVRRTGLVEQLDSRFKHVYPKEVFIPRNQEVWILTPKGPYVLNNNRIEHFQTIDGIDCSSITCVFEDREGILWIAVEGSGLLRLRKKQVQTFTTADGLETNEVMCGMEDRAGNIWMGTWLGGLSRNSTDRPGTFRPVPPLVNGTSIITVCEARDGTVWVGTWAGGVYTIKGGQVKRFLGKGLDENTSIRQIINDTSGGVWIATIYGMVGYYRGAEQKTWDSKNGLTGSMINSILMTRSGDLWVGTDGGGVARFSNGHVSILNTSDGVIDDFAHIGIEDRDGSVWLTSKRGLQRWRDGKFSSITAKQGFDDDPAQFIQDDDGDYWIAGTHGIHRIRHDDLNAAADGVLSTLSYLTIGTADGMPVEESSGGNNQHVWKTRDGALWFSTTHGAVRFDPRIVASNPVPPGVIIEQVQVEHHPVVIDTLIVLHPQETKIEFHYTGINFAAPEQLRFRYKLQEFDPDWRDVGKERFAQYTNLDPGTYTFRVKAVNNAGVWNERGATLAIKVLPAFWQTWWFRALAVLIFFTSGPMIYVYRVRQLKREQENQREFSRRLIQSQEQERQRIANELHDSLGQTLLVIKNRML